MRSIGTKLNLLDPDIVGLQEAFIDDEIALLLAELEGSKLKHHQYYGSATVGSGLLLLSAFPIAEIYFHRYTVANPFYTVWEGDWWVGKGVSLARLALPDDAGYIDVYNTHAQAHHGSTKYDGIRAQQMTELATVVNESRLKTAPALLVGDMNCSLGEADYERAVQGAALVRLMNLDTRIDHIFGVQDAAYEFDVIDTVEIQETVSIGGKKIELSDHSGYMSTIKITPTPREPI